jgi:hypothetical protein
MIKIDNISLIMRGVRANHVESIKLQQRRIRVRAKQVTKE